jgi:hypothetical protein
VFVPTKKMPSSNRPPQAPATGGGLMRRTQWLPR